MIRVSVDRKSADQLVRKRWDFEFSFTYKGPDMVLINYAEETRQSTRHKFKGPFWSRDDERKYHSKLSRPKAEDIPEDIIRDAIRLYHETLTVRPYDFYIGWVNDNHYVGKRTQKV